MNSTAWRIQELQENRPRACAKRIVRWPVECWEHSSECASLKRSDSVGTSLQLQQHVWKQKATVSQSRDSGREEKGGESTHLLELSAVLWGSPGAVHIKELSGWEVWRRARWLQLLARRLICQINFYISNVWKGISPWLQSNRVLVTLPDTFLGFFCLFPSQTAGFAIAILQIDHRVPSA